jgi:hypothetical protein
MRGETRSSRFVVRVAMDAAAREMMRAKAYGQAVWSCPLDAGVKLRKAIGAATVTKKPDTPGRARSKP